MQNKKDESIKEILNSRSGMTIVELIVAFAILIFLTGALGAFLSTGLNLWSTGEKNKDIYDRAEKIISQIRGDIKNIYTESALVNNAMPPIFLCDEDNNRNQRLRFVISGLPSKTGVAANPIPLPPYSYTDLYEVGYIFDALAKKLQRGIRYFDRNDDRTIFNDNNISAQAKQFPTIDSGVLYISYEFWSQYTTTWDEKAPLVKSSGNYEAGPSNIWDSSRKILRNFIFFQKTRNLTQPDFVYPSSVKITLVLEPQPKILIKLLDTIGLRSLRIPLEGANRLPPAPDCVQIDNEWIEYKDVTDNSIVASQRGARNTKPSNHDPTSKVAFGYTFTYEIPIPVFRSAEYYEE